MAGGNWQRMLGGLARVASDRLARRAAGAGTPRTPVVRTARAAPRRKLTTTSRPDPTDRAPSPAPRATPTRRDGPGAGRTPYPGDYTGPPQWEYEPSPDGVADPGEVVWAWVPYEEDHAQGKDRPALVVGRDGPWLLALPMTSKDHDRDAAQEASVGRHWVDVGSGSWDASGRASEARVDRVVRLDPRLVRREGATLPRPVFDQVVAAWVSARGSEGRSA